MTSNSGDINKSANAIAIGVFPIALGIVAIAVPSVSTIVVETWIAIILATARTAKLFYVFQTRTQGGFAWKLFLSILYVENSGFLTRNSS